MAEPKDIKFVLSVKLVDPETQEAIDFLRWRAALHCLIYGHSFVQLDGLRFCCGCGVPDGDLPAGAAE